MLRRHPRLVALGAVAVVGLAVFAVALARSVGSTCALPPPTSPLVDQLRSLGDFDQPYDTADRATITDAAARAASALHPELPGTFVEDSVRVAAAAPASYDALVVPLTVGNPRHVVALVSFLLDCRGRAWFSDVDDLLHEPSLAAHLPPAFPAVGRDAAAAELGGAPRLVYDRSVFRPLWTSGGRSVAAFPG